MTASLIAVYLLFQQLGADLGRQATVERSDELQTAVLENGLTAAGAALNNSADPNLPLTNTPYRLSQLGQTSHRLAHYFAEENKAAPLCYAAALGEGDMCKLLLLHGAKQYGTSSWGWVAAQYAAKMGYPELAQSLIDSDPNAEHFRILVDLSAQKIVLYKDQQPLVSGRISTGRKGFDTPPGEYLVTDKEPSRRSSLYKVSMPYFLRLSFSEYGIHQGFNPGRPASHGCIRVGEEKVAKQIYSVTPIGTLVTVR